MHAAPILNLNIIRHVTGIPIAQYAKNVMTAATCCLPEALTDEAAIP